MPPKKKGGKKKQQEDYWEEDFAQDAEALGITPKEEVDEDASIAKAVAAADRDEEPDFMTQLAQAANKKKGKGSQKKNDAAAAEDAGKNDAVDSKKIDVEPVRIKTKKEKEREKKEREKEAKRLQAAQRKTEEPKERSSGTVTPVPAPTPPPETVESSPTESAPAKKNVKGKKKGGAVAALQAMVEAQRAAEEKARQEFEELKRQEEERIRAEEEEERTKEGIKQRKRERERAKKEELRKQGKLLTKAQKEAQRQAEIRTQQLLDSGVINVEALKSKEEGKPAKRVVYSSKKKKGGKSDAQKAKEDEEAAAAREAEEEKKRIEEEKAKQDELEAAEESNVKDDWENSDPEPELEGVKESWDMSSDEEEEEVSSKLAATSLDDTEPKEESDDDDDVATKDDDDSESDDDDDSGTDSDDDSEEEMTAAEKQEAKRREEAKRRREERHEEALAARSADDLRSPICVILGHVDTGKTKLLDKIRQTNVQEGEAGGITQQIGATYFPVDTIKQKTEGCNKDFDFKIPGLLVIDTPGHESFTNLRSRGSSLCNIAILVVDIVHGLEPQTLESIRLLRERKTPFIVALNKIDRVFDWQATPNSPFLETLAKQKKHAQLEFADRVKKTIVLFAEQGLNACLYYENKNVGKNVSLVPTSAITGEGVPDLLMLLVKLTQTRMSEKLMYISSLQATVLEVKVVEGLGTTIDVILSNGVINEGDRIVVCGLNGPIVTNIRALLTPQPLRELRIKSAYMHHKSVKAAQGIKICAPDLEKAVAGSRMLVVGPDDDEEELKDEIMSDLQDLMSSVDRSGQGVCVQASTLGSLEALLEFLRTSEIPVSGISIGPVHRRDVIRASTMLEKAKEYAVVLCFDVKVDKEAQDLADELGIRIFTADIIYHLFDDFTAYKKDIDEQKRKDSAGEAVFPCVLKMVPGTVVRKKDPIIIGVDVVSGNLRIGTPICVIRPNATTGEKEVITLGKVTSMEINRKAVDIAKKGATGGGVAVKIEQASYESAKVYGRHFDDKDLFYSKISRQSIDILKENFKNDLSKEEWALVIKLKGIFGLK